RARRSARRAADPSGPTSGGRCWRPVSPEPPHCHNVEMTRGPTLDTLTTDRLVLRRRSVDEASVYRQLWMERDPRVPQHRRISPEGRPTVEDVAAQIGAEGEGPGLLAVERKDTGDVIGYCGLVFHGTGAKHEPELAYELLRSAHGFGYATAAGRAVVAWVGAAGYSRLGASVRER